MRSPIRGPDVGGYWLLVICYWLFVIGYWLMGRFFFWVWVDWSVL